MAVLPGALRIGEIATLPLDDLAYAYHLAALTLEERAAAEG